MRRATVACAASAVGLIGAGVLGSAAADAPPASVPHTVSVQGVGIAALDQGASATAATGAYRTGMAAAITDAQAKAQFLAGAVRATVGPVQALAENGGGIDCGADDYAGAQPDFGSPGGFPGGSQSASSTGAAVKGPAARKPAGSHRKPAKKHARGKHNKRARTAAACTITAQVSVVYQLG